MPSVSLDRKTTLRLNQWVPGRFAHLIATLKSPYRIQDATIRWKLKRSGLERVRVDLGDGGLSAWVGRSGSPLLLLQGFGTDAVWQWHPQIKAFSRRHRLFVPDLMFFGRSTSKSAERSLDFQARAVLQLMDHYEIESFDLLGSSYGGLVAYHLARNYPDRVAKLILVGTPGPVITPEDYDEMLAELGVADLSEVMVPTGPDGLKRLIEVAFHRPPRVPQRALEDVFEHLFTDQVDEKRELLTDLLKQMRGERLVAPLLPHEILLVWGRYDRIFPVDLGRRLRAKLRPSAQLHVIDKAGHAPNQERVREFNRTVLAFLAAA
jgi:pimeloyl-ACP methyl ester carboxylesterase